VLLFNNGGFFPFFYFSQPYSLLSFLPSPIFTDYSSREYVNGNKKTSVNKCLAYTFIDCGRENEMAERMRL